MLSALSVTGVQEGGTVDEPRKSVPLSSRRARPKGFTRVTNAVLYLALCTGTK